MKRIAKMSACFVIIFVTSSFINIKQKSLETDHKSKLYQGLVQRNLLAGSNSIEDLKKNLVLDDDWIRFPAYTSRDKWMTVDEKYRQEIIKKGEAVIDYQWKLIPATGYLDFVRSGNRGKTEKLLADNTDALRALVNAELFEGKGRFTDQIVNGVWMMCEMSTWALPAHLNLQKAGAGLPDAKEPIIDLVAGVDASLLSYIYYFFHKEFDKINPLIAQKIENTIQTKILEPFYNRDDFFWMGLKPGGQLVNNWNVWINYNMLTTILIMEKDPEKRLEGVYKTMRSVDNFINSYPDDGACNEGPGYWNLAGCKLFQYIDVLKSATKGGIDIFDKEIVRNMGAYIYKVHIAPSYYVNFADASPRVYPDPGLVFNFGKAVKDEAMMQFGSQLAHEASWNNSLPGGKWFEEQLANFFDAKQVLSLKGSGGYGKNYWMKDTEIAIARDEQGSTNGFYFAAKGGTNGESHNHNDVGSFIMFYNGAPVLIDVGNEDYTAKTFSKDRYSIWCLNSLYHNIVTINGQQQSPGPKFAAKNSTFINKGSVSEFSTDVAGAYPPAAGVVKWIRSYSLNRHKSIEITDEWQLKKETGNSDIHFMSNSLFKPVKPGIIQIEAPAGTFNMLYDKKILEPKIETIPLSKEGGLQRYWGKNVYRLILIMKNINLTGKSVIKVVKVK